MYKRQVQGLTWAEFKDQVVARELDNIRVKGKNRPVVIYELLDVVDGLEAPKDEVHGKTRGK